MNALIVDASVLVTAVTDSTDSTDSEWAETLLGGAETLIAPHLAFAEAANILRRARLSRRLTPAAAAAAYGDLLLLDLELVAYSPFAARIWELSSVLSSYDAWYVAVAEAMDSPLATLDRRLSRAAGVRCEFLLPA